MDVVADGLLVVAASRMRGTVRRRFLAEVCEGLCDGNPRRAEERFGWGRETIAKGQAERESGPIDPKAKTSRNRGQKRSEDAHPQLAVDIRLIVEPRTRSDPELKSSRQYTNMSASEVRQALCDRGYTDEQLPRERTLRDVLNRMNYRLKRIPKGKPLKKTAETDAIFENVKAARAAAERRAAGQLDDRAVIRPSHDLERATARSPSPERRLCQRNHGLQLRDARSQPSPDPFQHALQIRHHHQTPTPDRQVNSHPPHA